MNSCSLYYLFSYTNTEINSVWVSIHELVYIILFLNLSTKKAKNQFFLIEMVKSSAVERKTQNESGVYCIL